MNKKYELTDETINISGHILHRIRAIKPFGNVKLGDLGGFIESEKNLEQEGSCWIYGDAQVYEGARVCQDAWIYGNSKIYGKARICGNSEVNGNAQIYEDALVRGMTEIFGNARVFGNAWVLGTAKIYGDAWMFGDALVYGNMKLDSGMWCRIILLIDNRYLVSTTLRSISMDTCDE